MMYIVDCCISLPLSHSPCTYLYKYLVIHVYHAEHLIFAILHNQLAICHDHVLIIHLVVVVL